MLREFIYVDTDKVRSLLAQLDGGVAEELKVTDKKQGTLAGGVKTIVSREQIWGTEESTQRSLADAIFPMLEDALESEGYLTDVSEILQNLDGRQLDEFQEQYPPGAFIRVTAPARLFDARYIAKVFGGIAVVANGLTTITQEGAATVGPLGGSQRGGGQARGRQTASSTNSSRHAEGAHGSNLEDSVPDFDGSLMGGVDAEQFRALVKLARGLFHPGLHVAMVPGDSFGSIAVTARLQEARRFLDSEPEVLFARYGLQAQEWTMVGTVGTYSVSPGFQQLHNEFIAESGVRRVKLVAAINDMVEFIGTLGMTDAPQYPGLSLVPFAVYRPILHSGNTVLLPVP